MIKIATILTTIPNLQEDLATLYYRKCQKEFITNVNNYLQHRDRWTFKSGDAEQHTEWQDLMEDIVQLTFPGDKLPACISENMEEQDLPSTELKEREQDMKLVGEIMRNIELSKFSGKTRKRKGTDVQVVDVLSDDEDFNKKLKLIGVRGNASILFKPSCHCKTCGSEYEEV